jgi:EAL domain-containing protein (putative c-di-GMP-specific phosphodiesterase class I)
LTAVLREPDSEQHVTVFYQPVVELETGRIVGAESLARWSAPTTGPVAPDVFIGVAEEIGVIGRLTRHIMRTALGEQVRRFQPASERGFSLSINLSAAHVAEVGFLAEFEAIVADSGVDRSRLWVELTESVVTAGPVVLEHLEAIRASGISVAVDDFGTGYSSFARLRNLPFNGIKIDRAFVGGIHHDPVAQALVAAQVDIAANLGLNLLAEGVETDEEREALRGIGVRYGQGFGLHRPMDAAALASLLPGPS